MKTNYDKTVNKVFDFWNILFMLLFSLLCMFPFYYIFINSISNNDLVSRGAVMLYPRGIHFTNYRQIFQIDTLVPAAMTSVARTIIGTGFSLISSSFMGYAMTKDEYWMRKFWYRFLIVTMYFSAGVIPAYINIKNLNLLNSFWVYVLPALVSPFNMILVKTYIESIPSSLEESAAIDGAGYLKRYFRVILPLSKPIISTVTIFAAVGQWNSFMDTVMYMTRNNHYTLQYVLFRYLNEVNSIAEIMKRNPSFANMTVERALTPVAVRYTVTAVTVLPIIMVYPFFQRYFVKGIMIGAVKG